jgi:hypothetical protein
MSPANNNRVAPSPYYPVFRSRMVMISYARRPRTRFHDFPSSSENSVCGLSAGKRKGPALLHKLASVFGAVIEKPGTVLDADSSQRNAIDSVVAGRSLVIHGPPGAARGWPR